MHIEENALLLDYIVMGDIPLHKGICRPIIAYK